MNTRGASLCTRDQGPPTKDCVPAPQGPPSQGGHTQQQLHKGVVGDSVILIRGATKQGQRGVAGRALGGESGDNGREHSRRGARSTSSNMQAEGTAEDLEKGHDGDKTGEVSRTRAGSALEDSVFIKKEASGGTGKSWESSTQPPGEDLWAEAGAAGT